MRKLSHISYSSFKLFRSDPEMFYRRYLAETKTAREPQNHYMAIGSAFDAFAKAELYTKFVGGTDPQYERDTLFEAQVEPHNRDMARIDGMRVFEGYKQCGAWQSLCQDMKDCINPRFEVELTGEIGVTWLDGKIVLLGKPDVMYINSRGLRVIHDFKVNGFYSKKAITPVSGYIRSFPDMNMHKQCTPTYVNGHLINGAFFFHTKNEEWAEQLSMYAWLLGADVGGEYVLSVDQICGNKIENTTRVVKHAGVCKAEWQRELFNQLHECWHRAESGHIFKDMSYEDNMNKIKLIDLELAQAPEPEYVSVNRKR